MLVADTSGESVDNKTRLDLVRQQEEFIKEEAIEKEMEREVGVLGPGEREGGMCTGHRSRV